MRRHIIMILILIACLVLPGTTFQYFSWGGIKPDITMLWVIYIALHHRPVQGVLYGFVIGLIVDFYLGRYIGLYAIILAVVAFLISLLQQRWYKENIPLTMLLVFIVTFLGQSLMVIVATTAGLNWYFGDAVKEIIGISFYNCLLVPLTYPFVHRSFSEGILQPKRKIEQQ